MPSGSKSQNAAKRRVVAKGAIAGQPASAIAAEAGCSERHVRRLLAEPETQFLISDVMQPHREVLRLMAKRAVAAVERGMKAQKKTKADHFTQLRAVERYGELLELAEGERKPEGRKNEKGRNIVTWTELLEIARKRKEAA
jgi:hypothetical protein